MSATLTIDVTAVMITLAGSIATFAVTAFWLGVKNVKLTERLKAMESRVNEMEPTLKRIAALPIINQPADGPAKVG